MRIASGLAAHPGLLSKLKAGDQRLVAPQLERLPADSLALLDASKVTLKTSSDFQMRFLQGCQGRYRRSSKELEVSRCTLAGSEKATFFGSFGRALATTGAIAAAGALLAGVAGPLGQVFGLAASVLAVALPAVSAITRAREEVRPSLTKPLTPSTTRSRARPCSLKPTRRFRHALRATRRSEIS
ncbi:MAG: hypothetical protein U0931_37025 [Vulcanimicrobiota bacterium]